MMAGFPKGEAASAVDIDTLRRRLDRIEAVLGGVPKARPTSIDLIRWAAFEMGLRTDDILGPSRAAPLARARFAVWWTARQLRPVSLPMLGRNTGGRNHTSVLSGVRRAETLRDRDPAFRALTDKMVTAFSEWASQ